MVGQAVGQSCGQKNIGHGATAVFVWAMAVVWLTPLVTSDLVDFDDGSTIPGWEFVYHHEHDLLLTVSPDSCYFSVLHDRYANRTLSPANRASTERVVYQLTQVSGRVVPSSLDGEREKFHDLLANFQCRHKHVFDLSLKGDDFIRAGIIDSYENK